MATSKEEYKIAYLDALKEYDFSNLILSGLHKVSEDTIDKWRYVEGRYPDFAACYELYLFLKRFGITPPSLLARIVLRARSRASDLARKLGENPLTGETLKHTRSARLDSYVYKLNGKEVSMKELSVKYGLSISSVRSRIKAAGLLHNDDVANVDFKQKKKGRPNK
ncbi:MAG: hypothetical protein HRU38_10915 [Saccharospirillaceae bacterium]|nr:hypothetical protein [Saccharospirillaceae bacterium]